MRRLNLDIFEPEERDLPTGKSTDQDGHDMAPSQEFGPDNSPQSHRPARKTKAPEATSPRFIPVGFFARHLRLLDDAVINLRRQGHWKASKSAIIRALIESNEDRLQDVWLSSHAEAHRKND